MDWTKIALLVIGLLFVLGVMLVLRLPKSGLLDDRVESLDINKDGISLRRRIQDIDRELKTEPGPTPVPSSPSPVPVSEAVLPSPRAPYFDVVRGIAQWSPSASVVEAGGRLERTLRELVPDGGGRPLALAQLVGAAARNGLLTKGEERAFREMATVRNQAAHGRGEDLTATDAMLFAELARQVAISARLNAGQVGGEPL